MFGRSWLHKPIQDLDILKIYINILNYSIRNTIPILNHAYFSYESVLRAVDMDD